MHPHTTCARRCVTTASARPCTTALVAMARKRRCTRVTARRRQCTIPLATAPRCTTARVRPSTAPRCGIRARALRCTARRPPRPTKTLSRASGPRLGTGPPAASRPSTPERARWIVLPRMPATEALPAASAEAEAPIRSWTPLPGLTFSPDSATPHPSQARHPRVPWSAAISARATPLPAPPPPAWARASGRRRRRRRRRRPPALRHCRRPATISSP
mmetsp:Transcript_31920/g.83504  ORF Transcript_31920/g.83504 Transcript_31920/m.83504 type:complete len:217 (-) Transcript_31920:770-1420(-)